MFELNMQEFNKVAHLLDKIDHNKSIIFSVIEGTAKGSIYVDDLDKPNTVFIFPENSFFYIAGNEKNNEFNNKLYTLIFEDILGESNDAEMVLFPLSQGWKDKLNELLKGKKAITIDRKTFSFDEVAFNTNKINISEKLLDGYSLKRIDKDIANKINVTKSWKSIDEFLNRGIGYCIVKDNEIVSACYSIYVGKGEAEVDIFTKEEYMGQGFGKIVATSFIENCLKEGLSPIWSCWPFREASRALAKKLGFKGEEDIQAYYWSPNM